MLTYIKQATIIAPGDPLNGRKMDILVENGTIRHIAEHIDAESGQAVEAPGLCVSIGWIDLFCQVGEPGLEHREDFTTAAAAAAAGGFCAVAVLPNTKPALHSKSEILLVKKASQQSPVAFMPVGAVTKNCEGTELAEIYDMQAAGAVAFSDGKNPIQHAGILLRALQYVKPFGGVVIQMALDKTLAHNGHLHEGLMSVTLGTRGIPALAEESMVQRDLGLLEYSGSRLHFANLSCARSVALVREAQQRGLDVTASANPLSLLHTDEALAEFDTNLKVMPPLRDEHHRQALLEGLRDGTLTAIASNHVPLDEEAKNLEFTYASFGAIGLETAFAAARTATKGILSIENLIEKLAYGPRKILGLPIPAFAEGASVPLTLFQPDEEWVFGAGDVRSKSKNTPFVGRGFVGRVVGVV